ncbi:hypothetical protein NLG97_g6043 [Lecanicillium saksenae]|uniref:Uncharacterized protein n=1 Tax=Lecanicillium saksenae TaxID=468837 RepID=A0ACC1QS46_9HYPO|nr:hypothetical protein NLG97_g6043 [Lecanicillium saksenae]
MPPLQFNQDLLQAQAREINRVSDLARGEDSGALKFTYTHEHLSAPVAVHMIAHGKRCEPLSYATSPLTSAADCMSYPENAGFIVFSEFEHADNDLTLCLDTVCQKKKWSNIEEAVQAISQAITFAIEGRHKGSDDDCGSQWDDGSDFEELDAMELSSDDGDHRSGPGQYDDVVLPIDARALAKMKRSLRKAQALGVTVGIYPRHGSKIPEVISLSAPASCLGVADSILESWGLKQTDNLVLLMRIRSFYPTIDEFLGLSSRQTVVQFRFGKSLGQKPSPASVQSAYRDSKKFSDDEDSRITVDENAFFPFELINMSSSIDKLLNADFMRLLTIRRNHKLSWENAQFILSRLELQSATGNALAEQVHVELLNMKIDRVPWQSLNGPISQDAALDEPDSFSLPLVAMQLALHRLANCTRYCMVCNACLNQSFQALKPYVCDKSLCLFQYLSLGLGSSIEHEIINAPYVVDMLVCFLYAALAGSSARELPDGLSIKTAFVDDQWAQGSFVAAVADMGHMKIRDLDYSTLQDKQTVKLSKEVFREGDRLLIIHREADPHPASTMDLVVKSWCRLTSVIDGEWTFERYHFTESKRSRQPYAGDSALDDLSSATVHGPGNWRRVQLFGYWQNIDEFTLEQRRFALLTILDGLPSILEMRKYLLAQPGRRLASWSRLNASELAVLNWTVASNRSLIVQDDIVANPDLQAKSNKPWNKIGTVDGKEQSHMQFRFLQGSPEMEQKFEEKALDMLKRTSTPTIFAWHGSRLKNWHSIIRTGLDFLTTENGRACGNGVYFSSAMSTSLGYCGYTTTRPDQSNIVSKAKQAKMSLKMLTKVQPLAWSKSHLQISSAIAVCELINSPHEFVCHTPHFVVDQLHWIQCRYLLVSINPTVEALDFPFYEPPKNDTPAYVLQDTQWQIRAGHANATVQIPITAIPHSRQLRQTGQVQARTTAHTSAMSPGRTTPSNAHGRVNYDADDVELYLSTDETDSLLPSSAMKRRGSSVGTDSTCQSQYSNKRARATLESTATDIRPNPEQSRNTCGFDPNALKMESLRLLEPPTWAATSKVAVNRLAKDLRDLHHRQTTVGDLSSGYYVHTDKSDNMFQWIVELFNFDPSLPLARDMQELNCPSIVMEFRFGPSYPYSPPFVRIVRPQFVPFAQGGGGHITMGGAVCLELLTSTGWNLVLNIDNVIMQIRAAISEPERPARIQKNYVGEDYGIGEAVAAFTRLANAHGWKVPEDFQQLALL